MESHTIEECWQKLCDLESLVFGFIENVNRDKEYTDADINGCRHTEGDISNRVDDITPITLEKTAYLEDTEVIFTEVPNGNMTVYCDTPHTTLRDGDMVTITFTKPLEEVVNVALSILPVKED